MKKILFLSIIFFIIGCNSKEKKTNSNIEIYDESIISIIDEMAEFEILADSIILPEGPLWDERSNSLLFVDVINNNVLKWNESEGVSNYIMPSGNTGYAPNLGKGVLGANGMGFDTQGNLVLCQHGDRRLAIIENESNLNPSFTTLIDNYKGKKLNSPNDLVISKTGEIYFTDPAFGFFDLNTFEFVETPLRELDFFGVYKFDTQSKILSLITDTVDLPNGIGLSPDEKTLYVNKMGMLDQNPKVLKINLEDLSSEVLFDGKELSSKYEGNFDGMVIHSSGNIFTSGPGGLLIISPQGELMAKINFGHVTNCTLDAKEEFLYVTGFLNNPKVFRLKLKT